MDTTTRLDLAMVARGLARSRTRAGELIRADLVYIDGTAVSKASQGVPDEAEVEVRLPASAPQYVSRAALKLAGALDALETAHATGYAPWSPQRIAGRFCVDVGASTGGFTDVLLRRGARHVLAIDVGHGQLEAGLRASSRVTTREGLNVRDLTSSDIPEPPALVVGDLSFISLRLVLPALVDAMPDAEKLLMVKPQFEVGRDRLGRGGVVRDAQLHIEAVQQVCDSARDLGLWTRAVVASCLPGPSGNREFFCWFSPAGIEPDPVGLLPAITAAVTDSSNGQNIFYVEKQQEGRTQ